MRLILESFDNINVTKLPNEINGNFWILDSFSKNLLNVVEQNNKWVLKSNTEIKISKSVIDDKLSNINYIDSIELEENNFYYIVNIMTKEKYTLYSVPSLEFYENFVIDYNQNNNILIGSGNKCDVVIKNNLYSDKQLSIELDKKTNGILIKNLDLKNKLFVNNNVVSEVYLANGDVIFLCGIYIYYFGPLLLVSDNKKDLSFNSLRLNKRLVTENPVVDYSNNIDKDVKFFDKDKFFQRPPRFKRKIETKTFQIDAPTQKENQEEMPLIFTIAPMLTMGMMSLVTGITSLQKVLEGKSTIKDEFSSLLICGCMMLAMIVFPLVQKFYTKMKKKQKERKRRRKYKKYIDKKHDEIFAEINYQKQVLIEDNLPIEKVRDVILTRSRNLWERKLEHEDFLELRLGIGTKKPDIEIKYPEEHFTLEEDDLKDIISDLVNESKDIVDVPITLNFKDNNKVGIIGEKNILNKFYDNLMLQIMAYHGYDMLRLVILTNDSNKSYWEKFRNLPYLWNNEKSIRYFATNKDDINKVTSFLMEEYNYRKEMSINVENISFSPYYLILTDDIAFIKNNVFIREILKSNINLGYSIVMGVNKLDLLPNECSMFVNVVKDMSGLFTNQMTMENQIVFTPDLVNFSLRNCITNISNIPIDINSGKFVLPKKYGFLEMFDVGNVNQLNILNRWKNNNIIQSLETPVGIDEQGELFKIDLHEKAHGPHGLVAGMTGSGKSEWIITYILSMAINYSPEEVQFVLIDYKGGGLALTFDNRENNIKLPHVVGTITNLDIVEIKRSLASIESELKRRQAMFKSAREQLNESSMDIYKYQDFYRQGKVKEPMSHLFIISDEFAELKVQQPEFMDKLISTARIGRSLGVHLILATQKPSGVVDDQIWSNSKFRVCLKVQDKSDSNDMLKCPDAAMIKETGRFYLQVGYNELFMKGQCAYAGMSYYESDKKVTVVDSTVDFVDEIGFTIKRGDIKKNNTQYVFKGEELPNVLNYIIETFNNVEMNVKPLWLSSIPKIIYVDKLKEKYNYIKEDYLLNPIIGEYDDPSKQNQGLLTISISKDGNVLIYGSSGSGKENLITTMLYSLMTSYSLKELNIYILDFGSEVLNNFEAAPHIGDIVHSGDDEKIENLFKLINSEISLRRKKFVNNNGNYQDYIKSNQEIIPNIVIIINSFEVFADLYEKYLDNIAELSRDSAKFGIYFIITSSSTNGVRTKISQNFKNILILQMNDEMDYRVIFGNTNGVVPSKFVGRGLVKIDKIMEFQTAYASDKETLYENIKAVTIKLLMQYKGKARPIPVLPESVAFKDINVDKIDINNIPIGIIKKNLGIAKIDLEDYLSYLISARSYDDMIPFIDKLLFILNKSNDFKTFVFDSKYTFEENKYNNINYLNSGFGNYLNQINNYSESVCDIFNQNNSNKKSIEDKVNVLVVILGLDKFYNGLKDENKKLFENILSKNKEINKVHFMFIDTANSLKKNEFNPWYKDSVDSSSGLWVGDGFAEQYAIKPTKLDKTYYDINGNKYGYLVQTGIVEFVKLIEKE